MKKKVYQKPSMEVVATDLNQQMLIESVRSVTSNGLDPGDAIAPPSSSEDTADPWNDGW